MYSNVGEYGRENLDVLSVSYNTWFCVNRENWNKFQLKLQAALNF